MLDSAEWTGIRHFQPGLQRSSGLDYPGFQNLGLFTSLSSKVRTIWFLSLGISLLWSYHYFFGNNDLLNVILSPAWRDVRSDRNRRNSEKMSEEVLGNANWIGSIWNWKGDMILTETQEWGMTKTWRAQKCLKRVEVPGFSYSVQPLC